MTDLAALVAKIMDRCVEIGGCLEWTGVFCNHSPQIHISYTDVSGKRRKVYKMCRRIVFEHGRGPIGSGLHPVMTCRNAKCLSLGHMVLKTTKAIACLAAKEGKFSTPHRRAVITAARRKRAKLSPEAAADIRACDTGRQAAAKWGIHQSMACRIRRGSAWKTDIGASVFTYRG